MVVSKPVKVQITSDYLVLSQKRLSCSLSDVPLREGNSLSPTVTKSLIHQAKISNRLCNIKVKHFRSSTTGMSLSAR